MNRLRTTTLAALAALALLFAATPAMAGGPIANCQPGQPFLWPSNGADIPYNPDQGDLGPLDSADALDFVRDGFDAWESIPTSAVTFVDAGQLPFDVTVDNFIPFVFPAAPDGLSAVVFDDTGEMFDLLFGPGSGVLGFAGPEWVNTVTCDVLEGLAFLNGPAFGSIAEALDVTVHEFGHYSTLDHTVVNGQILLGDTSGPTPDDTFPIPPLAGKIETMYPFYFGPLAGSSTPDKDDVAIISALYPDPSFAASAGTATGTIFGPNGTTRLSGVNVIARNVANPFDDAVSSISGDLATVFGPTGTLSGIYTLRGLTPGASYNVYVDEILAGAFNVPALSPLPGPEEFHNAGESSTDDPLLRTNVSVAAGATASNVNVIFNTPGPGDPLAVGDDGSVQLFLPFTFEICGQAFTSVFVNGNGNLTFGAANGDFSESILEMLSGPPRIAGLWDDLNPGAGGTVFFNQTPDTFTVTYQNVPEFIATGSNTFSIVLTRSSSHVDVFYGALSALDGLAGVSCGSAVTSGFERALDLTQNDGRRDVHKAGALFELFGPGNPVDLAGRQAKYNLKETVGDAFESNGSIAAAKAVALPFDTSTLSRFTNIAPAGNDADFFRFSVQGGDILALEIVRGGFDSVIGVFDADSGTLLALDDDGGDGLLSRLLVQVDVDRNLAVAVSSFPDLDFSGNGTGGGRYVLTANTYRGTLLAAGDDTTTSVPLGFTFPYQGGSFTSVFVNSNGNLTFGAGSTDFTETVPELLSGPPRIAPRWDDLNAVGGLVIAEPGAGSMTIHFVSVPEFLSTSPNYFSVALGADGGIGIDYGATTRTDGITGVTQGGGAADPGETDLSADPDQAATGTTYELFGAADVFSFDLFFSELGFED